jgi:hypothetical protein
LDKIETRLNEELDYRVELKNLIKYSSNNPDNETQAIEKYSSSLVLTQVWVDGASLVQIQKNFDLEKRKIIAETLVAQYLKQVFIDGFFQGDNNLSNFIVDESSLKTHWIDFGNWVLLPQEIRESLFGILYKTINKEEINFLGHFQQIGFDLQKLKFFQNSLPNLLEILFDPFLENRPYDLPTWKIKERIEHLLGENKWWFRSSGDSTFLELMKSFIGLIKIVEYLDVNINWQGQFLKILPFYDVNKIGIGLPEYPNTIPQSGQLAQQLIIHIFKHSKEHVRVELPATTLFDIESFIPGEVKTKLQERSLNLSTIKFDYLKKGLIPGEVFVLDDSVTSVHVYLI